MMLKIIKYFNQFTDILKRLLVLVMVILFIFWKSKGLFDKNSTPFTTSDYSITPKLRYYGTKTRVKFNGS